MARRLKSSDSSCAGAAMGAITRAKRRRLDEEERLADRISSLPDDVLGEIVSLLPTRAGARTQVLSTRWRHIWRSAPLNMDLHPEGRPKRRHIAVDQISRALSAHPGPGRRLSVPRIFGYLPWMDGWLRSPALDNLQEVELISHNPDHWSPSRPRPLPPLPSSVHRFSCTLRVACFGGFDFPADAAEALRLPRLQRLTLSDVAVSEASLHAMLAGAPALQSLLLLDSSGFSRLQIKSPGLRSIGVRSRCQGTLVLEDAPCLQRLLLFVGTDQLDVSVVSAPRLGVLGKVYRCFPKLYLPTPYGATTGPPEGLPTVSMTVVLHSVKLLALSGVRLSLQALIDVLKCVPNLEKLYIEAASVCVRDGWYHKHWKHMGTLGGVLRLRTVVLGNYHGNKSHVNLANFFVSTATALECMRIESWSVCKPWTAIQRRLLNTRKMACRGARFEFVSSQLFTGSLDDLHAEQVHDLSTADPFLR